MRNGNAYFKVPLALSFLVLTVPMRNGNILASTASNNVLRVLTVPMRNGNFQNLIWSSITYLCSYRTYEEWKLIINKIVLWLIPLFLPYLWGMETWLLQEAPVHTALGSYRTYEEWKRGLPTWFQLSIKRFLPYLWGMETVMKIYVNIVEIKVLTVPMRNGNYHFLIISKTST